MVQCMAMCIILPDRLWRSLHDHLFVRRQRFQRCGRQRLIPVCAGSIVIVSRPGPSQIIQRHAESLLKLKEEKEHKESVIADALKESVLEESKRLYHEALIHVAIYAMKADGILDEREKELIAKTAKLLDTNVPKHQSSIHQPRPESLSSS